MHDKAQAESIRSRKDLHERHRLLSELGEYDHLHRIYRLCTVHAFRNIQSCGVSPEVRQLMRSLICMEHDNWDETIAEIKEKGGKAGLGKLE